MRLWMWVVVAGAIGCVPETNVGGALPTFDNSNPVPLSSISQTDRILQATIPSVDVLFVVDNSCSMEEEQAALGVNFPAFVKWFLASGLDYHVGVVSTDMRDPLHAGRLRVSDKHRWIEQSTPNAEAVFSQMVQMGTTGDALERGRAAAYTALELLADVDNAGFVRQDAGLHLAVVSDEDDASGASPVSREEFVAYLNEARPSPRMVSFSSIVGPLTGCPDIGEPGTEYLSVTELVGGVFWPICTKDWTQVLDELGFVATGLTREFHLSRLPALGTLSVSVEDAGVVLPFDEGDDWVYVPERKQHRVRRIRTGATRRGGADLRRARIERAKQRTSEVSPGTDRASVHLVEAAGVIDFVERLVHELGVPRGLGPQRPIILVDHFAIAR